MSSEMVGETEQLLAADPDHEENYGTTPSSGQSTIVGSQAGDEVLDAEDDPLLWPTAFKRSIVWLLAAMAFTVTFNCISVIPVAGTIVADLSGASAGQSYSVLLITIWELGEAAGPLLIGPLSEAFGRYPVMNAGNVLFISATVLAALSPSINTFIAARALTGLAVTANVLNPAVVGDIFPPEKRGSAMSVIQLAPLIGGAIGPAISGAVAQSVGWRSVLWISASLAAACEAVFLTFFRETYKVQLQRRRRAKSLCKHGGGPDGAWRGRLLFDSIRRPARVLASSGVLMALTLFGSVMFAHYYVMSVTLPQILQDNYGLSPVLTGSALISFSIGSALAVTVCNQTIDRIYIRLRAQNNGVGQPEHRLPLVIVGGVGLPLSVMLYGWSAELRLPLYMVLLPVVLLGATLMFTLLPLFAYVVDAFGVYSASALTALIVLRCLAGTFLPLTTTPLADALGYGWGFTVLGLGSLLLAPVPVVVMRYGAVWRQRSGYSRDGGQ
ncbi:hypothetical protein S40288_03702 [Stachybotrys chartarum IBT 40288]|nr:hypothetical protein S40288_03702 [Stachybotrys chartarum IBT 40288]